VIPNGFEKPAAEPLRKPATPPRIGFIGYFDYFPNRDGIEWFVQKCWPRIQASVPEARLRLVGQGCDGPLKPAGPNIDARGWLADPSAEIATWSAMIVPIRLGAGTRVKIAQGFSRKCPMVSTSLGAFGYDVRDGEDLFLADDANAFADACVRAIRQPAEANAMADRAWRKFLEKWSWEAIGPRIRAAAEDGLRLRRSAPDDQLHAEPVAALS
jgi:glycosyltransferase involved in cell wall biosynthesis